MISNKRGVQSHLLIIVIVSAFMTLLILSVLSTIFISDPDGCQNLNFEILDSTCKEGGFINLDLKNVADKKFQLYIEGSTKNITLVPSQIYRFKTTPNLGETKVVMIPFFESVNGNQLCRGKKKSTKEVNMIVKC